MIGARTVTSLGLLATALVYAAWVDLFSPVRLRGVDAGVLFWCSAFATVVGYVVCRLFGAHGPSLHYLRCAGDDLVWEDEVRLVGSRYLSVAVGKNPGDAVELGRSGQYGIFIFMALVVSLASLNRRTLELIKTIPTRLAEAGTSFCPTEEDDVNKGVEHVDPGCVLIRRAFELGYAKDLGPCKEEGEDEAQRICTLRQHDEPLLHYAWRLLGTAQQTALETADSADIEEVKHRLTTTVDNLETLYDAQGYVVSAAARASHHIWTNLPASRSWLGRVAQGMGCDRFRGLAHDAPVGADDGRRGSRHLEHVLGQLLFDPRFMEAAGSCREYSLHWDASEDACKQLAADPERFLAESDALADVRAVLQRLATARRYAQVVESLGERERTSGLTSTQPRAVSSTTAQRVVSFQCYIEAEGAGRGRVHRSFELDGQRFEVEEIRVSPKQLVEEQRINRYPHAARTLFRGFHYGRLMSAASAGSAVDEQSTDALFDGREGYLAKLEYLADMDVFTGETWLLRRKDLLEVYPYHLHLRNFVEVFRRQYRAQRGRL